MLFHLFGDILYIETENQITERNQTMTIKLLKKGIRVNGKYYPCFYSSSKSSINGKATIYLRTYDSLPPEVWNELEVQNNSDSMTDYFEKDRIKVSPGSPLFARTEELAGAYQ